MSENIMCIKVGTFRGSLVSTFSVIFLRKKKTEMELYQKYCRIFFLRSRYCRNQGISYRKRALGIVFLIDAMQYVGRY